MDDEELLLSLEERKCSRSLSRFPGFEGDDSTSDDMMGKKNRNRENLLGSCRVFVFQNITKHQSLSPESKKMWLSVSVSASPL